MFIVVSFLYLQKYIIFIEHYASVQWVQL